MMTNLRAFDEIDSNIVVAAAAAAAAALVCLKWIRHAWKKNNSFFFKK